MNIALVRPSKISGAFEKILIQEPINLAYLGAFLKANGFSVFLWDFETEHFTHESLRKKIKAQHIEIVGMTAMTPTINNAHDIALCVKEINPDIKVIIGGPHASALPKQTLDDFPAFDFCIIGEGELPLLELCRNIKNNIFSRNISALSMRKNKQIIVNESFNNINNLDELPFPDRALFNPNAYKHLYAAGINLAGKRSTVVLTSRGCAQKCTFCAVQKTSGPNVRFRSSGNVIAELMDCKEKFGYSHITFEDTNLTLNRKRFIEICHGLKRLRLSWDCQTKVSLIDEELISIMKECGCLKIAYGVESGSQRILDLMKKNITITQIKNAFRLTRKAKIVSCAFFILGSHPEETVSDIQLTEKLINEIKPDVFQLAIICPYPGTEIHTIMQKAGLIKDIDWKKFNFMHSKPLWATTHINAQTLKKYQKNIYLRYIFSPFFIFQTLKKLLNPKEAFYLLRLSSFMIHYLIFESRD
ncbi:MAG: cobalamin B12-binding domain-containing protein [Candidatus Omnitrophica bacterium]|nr:cobalamin B12-binding domain-containing protein [Candidatus Omnitrophota bacterium]